MAYSLTLAEAEAWRLCGPLTLETTPLLLHTVTKPIVITSMSVINWNTGGTSVRFCLYLVPAEMPFEVLPPADPPVLPPNTTMVISELISPDTTYFCEEIIEQPLFPGENLWAVAMTPDALNVMATAIYVVK